MLIPHAQITYNLHSAGITPLSERNNPKLASAVNVLATSVDRKGKRFVAAMEHRSLPFYGTQFHPEKPDFVPNSPKTHIPKQPEARAVGLYLAEFFVNATRAGVQQRQQQSQQL
jgi:gamma-glutamyl hydrolase